MKVVAGHFFPDFGACCCGVRWTTIRNARPEDIHKTGISHSGPLTPLDYATIEMARRTEDERIEAALLAAIGLGIGIGIGIGIGGNAPGSVASQ